MTIINDSPARTVPHPTPILKLARIAIEGIERNAIQEAMSRAEIAYAMRRR